MAACGAVVLFLELLPLLCQCEMYTSFSGCIVTASVHRKRPAGHRLGVRPDEVAGHSGNRREAQTHLQNIAPNCLQVAEW